MLLFIVIFFVMVIAVGASAVLGFSFYLKRRPKSLAAANNNKQFNVSPPGRSLFEPDAEELRSIESEKENLSRAKNAERQHLLKAEKAEKVRLLLKNWQSAPTVKTTAEILRRAAEAGSAEIFSETAENVLKAWREHRIENLSALNLAELLDSHFRLLPQQERTSGAIFWVKREIENLRSQSEEIR